MSDLTVHRDHLRALADSEHREGCIERRRDIATSLHALPKTFRSCGSSDAHEPHRVTKWTTCLGICPGCNPPAERELAARLADEIDAYLAASEDEGEGLFE